MHSAVTFKGAVATNGVGAIIAAADFVGRDASARRITPEYCGIKKRHSNIVSVTINAFLFIFLSFLI